jgi:glutathione synthase
MKPIKIGFVMDRIETINPKKDTTLAFMLEAQSRGWELVYLTLEDLILNNDNAEGLFRFIKVFHDLDKWYEVLKQTMSPLKSLDIIFMRKDPPFDIEYIMATYILEHAQKEGVLLINNPRSLRDANEKVFTSNFPQCCPPSVLTRSKEVIKNFIELHQKIVLKPTDKMGGQSIFVISKNDPNTNVIIEEMTRFGSKYVQAQAYIPEIIHGDKRILLINGVPISKGISRIPQNNDHRGNMAAGAMVQGFELTERDLWICHQLSDELKSRGLFFVGIDIIGDYLTEINVTSPTGVLEIDRIFNLNCSSLVFDALEKLHNSNRNAINS